MNRGSAFESTPIVVDGRLFFTTPRNRVIALDPETGRELWTFDPKLEPGRAYANMWINRGVAYWRGGDAQRRVRAPRLSRDPRRAPVRARRGDRASPARTSARSGSVDLLDGIAPLYDDWEYNVTSPGTVVGDVIVVGSSIADVVRPDAPPGDVRAFDVRTGALRWTFHTIPHAGRARSRDLGVRHATHGRGERVVDASRPTSRAAGCSCR